MRSIQLLCSLAIVLTLALSIPGTATASIVSEVFVPDAGYKGGGYWEVTVTNDTGDDVYLVVVGNNGADVIFTAPTLVGKWTPIMAGEADWNDGINFFDAGFTAPNTTTLPYATYFPGYESVLVYYMLPAGSPIADGATQGGFRFLSSGAGSPFLLFDSSGAIVEQGETSGPALPVEDRTWGAVKSLYR